MISSSESLVSKCFYRGQGVFCVDGYLFHSYNFRSDMQPGMELDANGIGAKAAQIDGERIQCPACEGKGMLLSDKGRELLVFLEVFARPFLRDLVDELFEEREQH
jgi:hypothetical protein